ncbi:unnamed protein product [Prorocentrum cordatum]|uniref:Transmembrane protein n=1 Tax=Prorocentrum cordatum TaxID=2364126 RepID=A0ABN9UKR2_9DINO|nr:unnamed protein product [Polarella glacialis]
MRLVNTFFPCGSTHFGPDGSRSIVDYIAVSSDVFPACRVLIFGSRLGIYCGLFQTRLPATTDLFVVKLISVFVFLEFRGACSLHSAKRFWSKEALVQRCKDIVLDRISGNTFLQWSLVLKPLGLSLLLPLVVVVLMLSILVSVISCSIALLSIARPLSGNALICWRRRRLPFSVVALLRFALHFCFFLRVTLYFYFLGLDPLFTYFISALLWSLVLSLASSVQLLLVLSCAACAGP